MEQLNIGHISGWKVEEKKKKGIPKGGQNGRRLGFREAVHVYRRGGKQKGCQGGRWGRGKGRILSRSQ